MISPSKLHSSINASSNTKYYLNSNSKNIRKIIKNAQKIDDLSYKVEKISETEFYYTLTISWEFFNKWAPVEVNSDSEIGIACRYKDEGDNWNHNGTSVDIYNPQTYVRIDKDLNTKKYKDKIKNIGIERIKHLLMDILLIVKKKQIIMLN